MRSRWISITLVIVLIVFTAFGFVGCKKQNETQVESTEFEETSLPDETLPEGLIEIQTLPEEEEDEKSGEEDIVKNRETEGNKSKDNISNGNLFASQKSDTLNELVDVPED